MYNENLCWHEHHVQKEQRSMLKKQKPCVLWFTGLSGSGKSTLANALELKLVEKGFHTYLLDGDNIRHGLNKDLGFDDNSRTENIRRIGEVCKLFVDSGTIVLSAFISPFKKDRENVRKLIEENEFIEIFVDTPLDICEDRDPKGLYKQAKSNKVENFTGISSPYENPLNPEIHLLNGKQSINENTDIILNYLLDNEYIK